MAEKKTIELNIKTNSDQVVQDLNNTTNAVENLSNKVEDTGKKSGVFNDIKNVITKMVPAFKSAEAGAVGFGASLKALMANPIILVITGLVAAVKFVYEAFQNTVVGAKAIDRVWSGLAVVITNLKDGLFGLARALAYSIEAGIKFISLDFEGASKAMVKANQEASSSWNTITDAINGTTLAYEMNLKKREQVNTKYKKKLELQEASINKLLLESREILTDETASINEKKKALELVSKEESKYSANKLKAAKEDRDIAEARFKQAKDGTVTEKKLKEELRLAEIAYLNAQTENAQTGIKLNRQRKMLRRQETAEIKEAQSKVKEANKAAEDAEKERTKAIEEENKKRKKAADDLAKELEQIEENHNKRWKELTDKQNKQLETDLQDVYDNQKGLLEAALIDDENNIQARKDLLLVQMANELENKELTEGEKLAIQKKYAKQIENVDKDSAEKRKKLEQDVRDAKFQIAKDSLTLISDITTLFGQRNEKEARKAFQVDKAAKLASATISGIEGTINAYTTAQKSPITALFPAYPAIQAGLAGAFAAVNIAKISQTQFQGGNNNIDSSNAPMGGASQSMTPQFNVVGGNQTSQLLQGLSMQPLKAYVVASDITTAQMLEQKAIKTSVL